MATRWTVVPFVEGVEDLTGGNPKTLQSDYLSKGKYAVVDQGKALVGGYVNNKGLVCKVQLPAIVFGDHTKCLKFIDFPFCLGADGVKVLRPRGNIDPRYLFHYLSRLRLPDGGYDRHFKYLKRCSVAFPDLAEQLRIARLLDRVVAVREKQRTEAAFASQLVEARFLEMFGDPVANPKKWPTLPLSDACAAYSGGTPSKGNKSYWKGDVPWFSPKDIKSPDLFDSALHISEAVPATTTLKLLPADTVVVVVRGMILARAFPVGVMRVSGTINQDMKALIPQVPLEAQFLASCLRCQEAHALAQVSEAAHGTKRLDAEGLRRIPVLLPPISKQKEFGAFVEATRRLEQRLLRSREMVDTLQNSIREAVFKGVP